MGAQVQAARMKDGETTGEVGLVPENYLTLVERIELEDEVDPNEEAVDWGERTGARGRGGRAGRGRELDA